MIISLYADPVWLPKPHNDAICGHYMYQLGRYPNHYVERTSLSIDLGLCSSSGPSKNNRDLSLSSILAMSDPNNPNIAIRTTPQWALMQREMFWAPNDGVFQPFDTGQSSFHTQY